MKPVAIISGEFSSENSIFCHTGKKYVAIKLAINKIRNIVWILCIMNVFCTKKKKLAHKILSFLLMKILDCTLRDGGYYNNWDFSKDLVNDYLKACLLYTSPSPRDATLSRMPSSA